MMSNRSKPGGSMWIARVGASKEIAFDYEDSRPLLVGPRSPSPAPGMRVRLRELELDLSGGVALAGEGARGPVRASLTN